MEIAERGSGSAVEHDQGLTKDRGKLSDCRMVMGRMSGFEDGGWRVGDMGL